MNSIADDTFPLIFPEVKQRASETEWQQRVNLAAAFRLCVHFNMADQIYAHLSAKIPDRPGHYLVNAYGVSFDEVTASNLCVVNFDGQVLSDPTGLGVNPSAFVVHGGLHKARPDLACVMHVHTKAGAAVSAQKRGLRNLSQHAMRFHNRIAYHDFSGTATNAVEEENLARSLADFKVMILRNHGLLTGGAEVREAFELLYFLELACQIQVGAMAGGDDVHECDDEAAEATAAHFDKPNRAGTKRDWPALLRICDRLDSSFRN